MRKLIVPKNGPLKKYSNLLLFVFRCLANIVNVENEDITRRRSLFLEIKIFKNGNLGENIFNRLNDASKCRGGKG